MTKRFRVLAIVVALVGCTPPAPPQPVKPKQAIAALATVQGRFFGGDVAFGLLPKSAVDASVLRQVAAFEEAVVPTLVDCLADTSHSQVEYEGRATSLGAVCFWTLLQTRFVQDRLRQDRGKRPTPDLWVSYDAIKPGQQRHAQAEWRAWLARPAQK
ncbi:MAG TPA: hypothetical protein VF034_01850 [Gemmatimonadaceae bacterium]|jgi:hypothetical protein